MGGVVDFDAGAMFILRTYKSLGDPTNYRWSNAYEGVALAAGSLQTLIDWGNHAVAFEMALHAEAVLFDSFSVSTWSPDSVPYDPENLYVEPLSGITGSRTVAAMLGLNVTAMLKRGAQTGRNGKVFVRGMLGEADVEREGTGFKFTNQAGVEFEVDSALDDSLFGQHLLSGLLSFKLALIHKPSGVEDITVRPITSLEVGGVVGLQLKRPWYNQPNRQTFAQRQMALAGGVPIGVPERKVRILA